MELAGPVGLLQTGGYRLAEGACYLFVLGSACDMDADSMPRNVGSTALHQQIITCRCYYIYGGQI